ncbi:acyltransferase [Hymenobacter sp. BRD128]|uniref:acyltransferase family protein n=1 Tax=Hymenobacter sp. BRD128 TaxID=2675878 RepID=UPI00156694EA|nr:acyltransferase [Hymenobacter sp. BRD128]QKG57038.1 acyltransferase [Hymenobacter sp. BRD128]
MPPTPSIVHSAARPYYPALTGLRAVAAYLVFAAHFRSAAASDFYWRLAERGGLGVGMFFVLSGFVIAARYQGDVQLTRSWLRRYLWRRAARIYPVFFLLNGLALWQVYWPLARATAANTLLLVFLSQSLLKGFSNTLMFVGLPQSWSLTTEECFYFSAPLVLLWQDRWRWAPLAFAALMMVLGVALTALCSGRPALHGLFGSYRALFNYLYFGRVLEFMMGLMLARWWAARPPAPAPDWPWRTITGLALMALAMGWLVWLNPHFQWYQGVPASATVITNTLFPLGVTLLLAGLLAERSWLRRGLSTPLLQALGRSSYFFYLLHVGVFSLWWQHRFGWGHHVGWQFVATLLLAELGYRLLEEPLRRWVLAQTLPREAAA